jgi:hypothetical protein
MWQPLRRGDRHAYSSPAPATPGAMVNGPGTRTAPVITVLSLPFMLALAVACAAAACGALDTAQQPVTTCGTIPVVAGRDLGGLALTSAQMSDARVIYDVAGSLGLPQRAAVIAEATSMQESTLLNLPSGNQRQPRPVPAAALHGLGHPRPDHAARLRRHPLLRGTGQSPRLADPPPDRRRPGRPALRLPRRLRQMGTTRRTPSPPPSPATPAPASPTTAPAARPRYPASPACQGTSPCPPAPRPRSPPLFATQPRRSASRTSGAAPARPGTTAPGWS